MSSNNIETNPKKSVLEAIQNPFIALGFICFSMIFTVKHSVLLYFQTTGLGDPGLMDYFLTGLAIAVLDGSIIVLAAHGQKKASQVFSFVIFLMNLLYFWNGQKLGFDPKTLMTLAPGLLWSLCYAYIIYYYGELFIDLQKKVDKSEAKNLELSTLRNTNGKLNIELEKLKGELERMKGAAENEERNTEGIRKELEEARKKLEELKGLPEKYQKAISLIISGLETGADNAENYRKKKGYWFNKYQANGLTPDEKFEALVKVDTFDKLYIDAKSN